LMVSLVGFMSRFSYFTNDTEQLLIRHKSLPKITLI